MNERRVEAQVVGPGTPGRLRLQLGSTVREVPVERIPVEFRTPNSTFVAVVRGGEFIGIEAQGTAWLEAQGRIREVLNADWDPIRVSGVVDDEYDSYLGNLYALWSRGASAEEIAEYLLLVETQAMGLRPLPLERRLLVARRVRQLELPLLKP